MPLVRIITIPRHVHIAVLNKFQSPVEANYFEYVGKNAAIRRACGEYVLITTADAWISPGFWELVRARNLSDRHYYRVGRVESTVELPAESLAWSQSNVEDFLLKHTIATRIEGLFDRPNDELSLSIHTSIRPAARVAGPSSKKARSHCMLGSFHCNSNWKQRRHRRRGRGARRPPPTRNAAQAAP
ncbi:MAG: hypothetical protein J3K34DRAFT_446214 [Monoraphidium minutum]|nr:MAG: hypothetical protein J3K34DRAFT_446214 [Monoraphidium minutum]